MAGLLDLSGIQGLALESTFIHTRKHVIGVAGGSETTTGYDISVVVDELMVMQASLTKVSYFFFAITSCEIRAGFLFWPCFV